MTTHVVVFLSPRVRTGHLSKVPSSSVFLPVSHLSKTIPGSCIISSVPPFTLPRRVPPGWTTRLPTPCKPSSMNSLQVVYVCFRFGAVVWRSYWPVTLDAFGLTGRAHRGISYPLADSRFRLPAQSPPRTLTRSTEVCTSDLSKQSVALSLSLS